MQLESIIVEAKDLTATTVTLVFKTTARLSTTAESAVAWGLKATVQGHGTRYVPVGNNPNLPPFPTPVVSIDTRVVGNPQTPTGLSQGNAWKPNFEATYQHNDISVPNDKFYNISAKMIPMIEFTESQSRQTTLMMDL